MRVIISLLSLVLLIVSCGPTPQVQHRPLPVVKDTIPTIDLTASDSISVEPITEISISNDFIEVNSYGYSLEVEDAISSIAASFNEEGEIIELKINGKIFKQKNNTVYPVALDNNTIVVQKGNTLLGISRKTGVPISTIKNLNNLHSDVIRPNQILKLK